MQGGGNYASFSLDTSFAAEIALSRGPNLPRSSQQPLSLPLSLPYLQSRSRLPKAKTAHKYGKGTASQTKSLHGGPARRMDWDCSSRCCSALLAIASWYVTGVVWKRSHIDSATNDAETDEPSLTADVTLRQAASPGAGSPTITTANLRGMKWKLLLFRSPRSLSTSSRALGPAFSTNKP